jgi:lipoate-protein ligase A
MARDRALLASAEAEGLQGDADAFLRFYAFAPAAISMGFHQREAAIDAAAARSAGLDVVRRPTGGAAVLHCNEITYCLVAPLGLPGWGRSVISVYGRLADCLVDALQSFGVGAACGSAGAGLGAACFAAAGGHEIAVAGRKLVGSAMRRGRRSFLVHGSILAGAGQHELAQYLVGSDSAEALSLATGTTHLEAEGLAAARHDELRSRIANNIAASLGADLSS